MTKLWAGPTVGWAYLVSVLDCCTREIVSWDLSLRCRSQDALTALIQAVLHREWSSSLHHRTTAATSRACSTASRAAATEVDH